MTQNLFCDNNSFQLFHYSLKIQISVILIIAKISPPKKVEPRKISLSQFSICNIAPVNQTHPTSANKLTGNSEINEPFRTKGEGNGTPLQYSCLENPMDGGAWWAAVHGVAKSRTRLSDFIFTFTFRTTKKNCKFSAQEYLLGFYTLFEPQCKILVRNDKSNSLLLKFFSCLKLAFTFMSNLLDCFNTIISILNKSEREGQTLCN